MITYGQTATTSSQTLTPLFSDSPAGSDYSVLCLRDAIAQDAAWFAKLSR